MKYIKLSPSQLKSLGLSPKSERYSADGGVTSISKRQYQNLKRGATWGEFKKKVAAGLAQLDYRKSHPRKRGELPRPAPEEKIPAKPRPRGKFAKRRTAPTARGDRYDIYHHLETARDVERVAKRRGLVGMVYAYGLFTAIGNMTVAGASRDDLLGDDGEYEDWITVLTWSAPKSITEDRIDMKLAKNSDIIKIYYYSLKLLIPGKSK